MTTASATLSRVGDACSNCGWALVSERGAAPWCARCGWNIDLYEPDRRHRELRWTWADKLSFQTAYDLNERQFADLSGRPVDRPPFRLAAVSLMLISLVVLACVVALAAFGVWLIVGLGGVVADILGALCILFAIFLRPKFGRLGKYAEPQDPGDFPAFDRLIEQVAAEIGAPRPHVVIFSMSFNAWSGAYGLRRRRAISIGLPLWLSLTPQEQVALIAHELGHFVNRDVRRGLLTRYAYQTLGAVSTVTRSDELSHRRGYRRSASGSMTILAELITKPLLAAVSAGTSLLQLGVEWIGARASHQAEYAADGMAARVAGSVATARLLDVLMLREACVTMLQRAVRGEASPVAWRAVVAAGLVDIEPRLQRLRQLTMRDDASMSKGHPPTGLRARLVESRPVESARIVLTEAESARIDADMASVYRTFKTDMADVSHS